MVVSLLHGTVNFTCVSSLRTISSISWFLDGSEVTQGSNIKLDFNAHDNFGSLILLNATVELNDTRVTCEVSHMEEPVISSITILRLQG